MEQQYKPYTEEFLDQVKDDVLEINTAQKIFTELENLDNNPSAYRQRWLWELLQNVLDLVEGESDTASVKVKIEIENNECIFSHSGRPFRVEEIAHLIHHGSTKTKKGKLGRFGTGFISTHLLSRIVNVSGILENGNQFCFNIDRAATTVDELKNKMRESWKNFKDSLEDHLSTFNNEYRTIYRYNVEEGFFAQDDTLNNLASIIPYVLAFNNELSSIEITINAKSEKWKKESDEEVIDELTKLIKISKVGSQDSAEVKIILVKSNDVTIACQITENNLSEITNVPKLFLAFPLTDTNNFPFPFVINSRKFISLEKRNGIYLYAEQAPDNIENKRILSSAHELLLNFSKTAINKNYGNLFRLASFAPIPDKEWLSDKLWLTEEYKKIATQLLNTEILTGEKGKIKPNLSSIPFTDDKNEYSRMFAICTPPYRSQLPIASDLEVWINIFKIWSTYFNKKIEEWDCIVTLTKLAKKISEYPSYTKLCAYTKQTEDNVKKWIYDILIFIQKKNSSIFETYAILPNQKGDLKVKSALMRDENISDELKTILEKLKKDIRAELLDNDVNEDVKKLCNAKKGDEVFSDCMDRIKKGIEHFDERDYKVANASLIKWILKNMVEDDIREQLKGYPILNTRNDSERKNNVTIFIPEDGPLIPPKQIFTEKLREYISLFPSKYRMDTQYTLLEEQDWEKLEHMGFILRGRLFVSMNVQENSFIDFENVCEDKISQQTSEESNKDHLFSGEMTKIPYLEIEQGIFDRIRKSKTGTKKFIDFLLKYLIYEDSSWKFAVSKDCSCGVKHSIYLSHWLHHIKKRQWVFVTKNQSETPSSKNFSEIFRGQENPFELLKEDDVLLFFTKLGISLSDLTKYIQSKDEKDIMDIDKAMTKIIAIGQNANGINEVAEVLSTPGMMEELKKKKENSDKIRHNQKVGGEVEKIIEKIFSDAGFNVKRTGIGSDYSIDNDFIENNVEIGFTLEKQSKRLLLEIKSTSIHGPVKMTVSQAEKSVQEGNQFILCVVPISPGEINYDAILNNSKLFINIGEKLKDQFNKVASFKLNEKNTKTIGGDINVVIEDSQVRFEITRNVWEQGKNIQDIIIDLLK